MEQVASSRGARADRPSFAKIAATGLAPTQSQPVTADSDRKSHRDTITSKTMIVNGSSTDAKPAGVDATKNIDSLTVQATQASAVGLENMDGRQSGLRDMMSSVSEESAPQPPSSGVYVKPSSVDGKSVASGTTFALDEKESLRPDDSASVQAAEDEEVFTPPVRGVAGSRPNSQDDMHAFRQQLRDISALEPVSRANASQNFGYGVGPSTGVLYVPPQGPGVGTVPGAPRPVEVPNSNTDVQPDSKLLEALDSPRDRIWVLKLEQDIFDFVKDPKESSLNLPQCNAYHRMLAHKIADYYMLGHVVDDSASAVRLFKTPNCRVPPALTGITTPSTAASTPPPSAPQMKILRRGDGAAGGNGSNSVSKMGSENGDSGNEDDKKKAPASREEREARYEAARLRIMGSARPTDMIEPPKEKDESRSSSVAGKKTKKKQRSDSEDGFEARSAYSAYYTQTYGPGTFVVTPHSMQNYGDPAAHSPSSSTFASQIGAAAYPPGNSHSPAAPGNWHHTGMPHGHHDTKAWNTVTSPGQDLAYEFQRAMSFPGPAMNRQGSTQASFPPSYQQTQTHQTAQFPPQQQFSSGYQQQWQPQPASQPQPPFQIPQHTPPVGYPYGPNYDSRPQSSSSHGIDGQPYQYGQLPSEAYPGRPSSKLEHPLPGSYKGKHFNPQSQAFVPTQQGARPMTPKSGQIGVGFGTPGAPSPLQRHAPNLPHAASFSAHHHAPRPGPPQHSMTQPMMHPLPQPVFARQPSPSMPLPPKPLGVPLPQLRGADTGLMSSIPPNVGPGQSSIAKWGTPASLPAKPPPSNEPFDPTRYPQLPRQASYTPAVAAARVPSMSGGYPVVNGSGPPSAKGL